VKLWKSVNGTPPSQTEGLWFYNALDCCVTLEVFEAIEPQLDEITRPVYNHALELQGPILEIEMRGILIDQGNVQQVAAGLMRDLDYLHEALKEILIEGVGLDPHRGLMVQKRAGLHQREVHVELSRPLEGPILSQVRHHPDPQA
jgi:hypothetical protein